MPYVLQSLDLVELQIQHNHRGWDILYSLDQMVAEVQNFEMGESVQWLDALSGWIPTHIFSGWRLRSRMVVESGRFPVMGWGYDIITD